MKIEQFFEDYKVKRNPVQFYSPYENRLIEVGDEDVINNEEDGLPYNHIWTLVDLPQGRLEIVTGMMYKNAIGYFASSKPWSNNKLKFEIE